MSDFTKRFEFSDPGTNIGSLLTGYVPIKEGSTTIFNHSSYIINDSAGLTSINYNTRQLIRDSGITTLDYENLVLINSAGNNVLLWDSSQLIASNVLCLRWSARTLNDSNGILALLWGTRSMYATNGTTIQMTWDDGSGHILLPNLPTSSVGLPSKALYSNAGVLTIVP